ncbi:MAG: hypothetical protein IPM53_08425 [Anaerolineaceae bacterium]|nr:hypothetical protein [Anaerolineaceae bacterium]
MLRLIWEKVRRDFWERRGETAVPPAAVQAAHRQFLAEQPVWANSLFDDCFLVCKAAFLFAGERLPSPLALATVWRSQFNVGSAEQKRADIHKLVPVMEAFLVLVEEKLLLAR